MFGMFGSQEFASTWYIRPIVIIGKPISVIGDVSSHGGTIINSNQDGTLFVNGIEVAVAGALHSCPIPTHGITSLTPITIKTFQNGKLILTSGAISECGAIILSPDRKVYCE